MGSLAKIHLPMCESCLLEKQLENFLYSKEGSSILELVYSNICEPMNVMARHGAYFFLSHLALLFDFVYLISRKSEAFNCFR